MPVARPESRRPAASAFAEPCTGGPRFARDSGRRVNFLRKISTASATARKASRAPCSVASLSAASHSASREGRSRSSRPRESSFHSASSRTNPIVTWRTVAPGASAVSRSSIGRKAMLSRSSVPPICIAVVTAGVWQRRMGRPAGFVEAVGLPGSLRRTKRFISAMRAKGVMRAKACLLRAVRKRAKSVWLWEQAAERTSRRAVAGVVAAGGAAAGTVTTGALGWELDSWAKLAPTVKEATQKKRRTRRSMLVGCKFQSILCHAEDRGQVLSERGARHHFVAAGLLGLGCEVHLHVREEAHDADVRSNEAQLLDGLYRMAARVQVHDNEFRVALHEAHEGIAVGSDFQFHAEQLGGFREFHLKKEIVHQRYYFSHGLVLAIRH